MQQKEQNLWDFLNKDLQHGRYFSCALALPFSRSILQPPIDVPRDSKLHHQDTVLPPRPSIAHHPGIVTRHPVTRVIVDPQTRRSQHARCPNKLKHNVSALACHRRPGKGHSCASMVCRDKDVIPRPVPGKGEGATGGIRIAAEGHFESGVGREGGGVVNLGIV